MWATKLGRHVFVKTVNVDFKTRSPPTIWYPTLREGNKEFMTLLNENKYGSLLHVPTIYVSNCMSFSINLPRESKE